MCAAGAAPFFATGGASRAGRARGRFFRWFFPAPVRSALPVKAAAARNPAACRGRRRLLPSPPQALLAAETPSSLAALYLHPFFKRRVWLRSDRPACMPIRGRGRHAAHGPCAGALMCGGHACVGRRPPHLAPLRPCPFVEIDPAPGPARRWLRGGGVPQRVCSAPGDPPVARLRLVACLRQGPSQTFGQRPPSPVSPPPPTLHALARSRRDATGSATPMPKHARALLSLRARMLLIATSPCPAQTPVRQPAPRVLPSTGPSPAAPKATHWPAPASRDPAGKH